MNFGQGFTNWDIPTFVKDGMQASMNSGDQSYGRHAGIPDLVNTLGKRYTKFFGREINPMSEIVVTAGATAGLQACLGAYCSPGDEVVCLAPYFVWYKPMCVLLGLTLKTVELTPPEAETAAWMVNYAGLEDSLSSKTRFLILNNPLNP